MASKDFNISYFDPERLFPPVEESSRVVIAVDSRHYSASAIARAVEDCDAHLINLNVAAGTTDAGETVVDLRTDHRNAAAVCRSLERYGYRVIATSGDDATDSDGPADPLDATTRDRVNEVLRYLSI